MPRRELTPPLSADQLRPLAPNETIVQFKAQLSDSELRQVATLLEGRADVTLRMYGGHDRDQIDLEFLRLFPHLKRLSLDGLYDRIAGFDGLRHVAASVEHLGLGGTKSPMSLAILERFSNLRSLFIEGPHRDIEAISALVGLEDLTLRSVTLPNLSALLPMGRLRTLDIKLGRTRDLGHLPRIGRLQYIELWMVRGLNDVAPLAEVETLQHVFLQALRNVTELPSFRRSTELRRFDLETMKGLSDLSTLAEAPNLEILNLIDMRHLQPEALRPFVGHPALRAGIWGLGSLRKNFAAQDLLPLPPEPYGYAKARRGEASAPERAPWFQPEWTGFRSAE
jgi:hypothetical protein